VPRQPSAARKEQKSVTLAEFRSAVQQVTSAVAVIAAQNGDVRGGLTVTAVCTASTDPPTMLICINRASSIEPIIADSGAFSINFLDEEQSNIARLFSTETSDRDARFAEGVWARGTTGAPVLEGSVSAFDCQVVETIPCGTHSIFLGRVLSVASSESNPLLYRDGFFRRMAAG
jgi:flavin reductase (DIM6/NTAB) family NADH-FMN oxidoreductase RutF